MSKETVVRYSDRWFAVDEKMERARRITKREAGEILKEKDFLKRLGALCAQGLSFQ